MADLKRKLASVQKRATLQLVHEESEVTFSSVVRRPKKKARLNREHRTTIRPGLSSASCCNDLGRERSDGEGVQWKRVPSRAASELKSTTSRAMAKTERDADLGGVTMRVVGSLVVDESRLACLVPRSASSAVLEKREFEESWLGRRWCLASLSRLTWPRCPRRAGR